VTDLDKVLAKILDLRAKDEITVARAKEIRELARSEATQKGALGPQKMERINNLFRLAINEKKVKVPPPVSSPTPMPGIRPPLEPTPPPAQPPSPGAGEDKESLWDQFQSTYNNKNLKSADKQYIQNKIFEGKAVNKNNWKSIDINRRRQLLNALSDFSLSTLEKREILGGKKPGNAWIWDSQKDKWTKPAKPGKGEWRWDDNIGWVQQMTEITEPPVKTPRDEERYVDDSDDDIEPGGGGDKEIDFGSVLEEDSVISVSTRSRTKIKFPEGGRTTEYLPADSEIINMPDVEKKTLKEINRITKELVTFAKEFIEAGQTFSSIDIVPVDYIFDPDDLLYYINDEVNTPLAPDNTLSELNLIMGELVATFSRLLGYSISRNPDPSNVVWYDGKWFFFGGDDSNLPGTEEEWEFNDSLGYYVSSNYPPPDSVSINANKPSYREFMKLFDLTYTPAGRARYTFGVEIGDDIIVDKISLKLRERDEDGSVDEESP
jgi:hypothetical protein